MSLKNIVTIFLIVLTLGMLFTGCSKNVDSDMDDTNMDAGSSDEPQVNDNNPAPVSDDSEVDEAVEDDSDEEVEIGSLI